VLFKNSLKRNALLSLAFLPLFISAASFAGGVSLGGTRLIYPAGNSQVSMPVNNSDDKAVFLIQSWVEDENGVKTEDFVITPPLFVIQPQKENTLRVMYVGSKVLPTDRESVYWLNVKAIPSASPNIKNKNVLQLAILSRIKLFVRPDNLPLKSAEAPQKLRFHRNGEQLTINNPTPYYITLVQLKTGNTKLPNTMVAPQTKASVSIPGNAQGAITYQTVSDFGANSETQKSVME